jgi:hypothetical protein
MRIKRTTQTLALGITAVAAVLLATITPAAAHETRAGHGFDTATVVSTHRQIVVCDNEADNHGVYADYATLAGFSYVASDTNGSATGCGVGNWDGTNIIRFRVCERSVSCSAWVDA